MDAITVWFSSLTKSGKLTALVVYVMVFMMASAVIATEYQYDQLAKIPAETVAISPYSQETLAAVTEDRRIVMQFGEKVPFKTSQVEDPTLAKGQSYIQTPGADGTRDVTYEVVYVDGEETERTVIEEKILQEPVDEVRIIGTLQSQTEQQPQPQTLGAQADKDKYKNTRDKKSDQTKYSLIVKRQPGKRVLYCAPSDEESDYNNSTIKGTYNTEKECLEASGRL